ncbi:MAG TPA: hypothetical protein VGL28_01430 [Steroidobacteraceae bacterium]|jgi:NADH:ubiquinone oxidoreductase subunit 6 (subunit J)
MFEYLGVLISVILGLALTHLLRGLAKVIHLRRTAKPYWVHIVWTFNTLLYVLALWWGMSSWNALRSWTIEWYLFIAGYASVMFMLASMLYPPDFAEDLDCEAYFFANKSWFFGLLVLALVIDIPETLGKGVAHLRDVPNHYLIFLSAMLLCAVLGLVSHNRRLHAAVCVLFMLTLAGYLTLTSLDRAAAHW